MVTVELAPAIEGLNTSYRYLKDADGFPFTDGILYITCSGRQGGSPSVVAAYPQDAVIGVEIKSRCCCS